MKKEEKKAKDEDWQKEVNLTYAQNFHKLSEEIIALKAEVKRIAFKVFEDELF